MSEHIKSVVASWGLSTVPTSHGVAAHTMTAVYLPEGMAPAQVRLLGRQLRYILLHQRQAVHNAQLRLLSRLLHYIQLHQ